MPGTTKAKPVKLSGFPAALFEPIETETPPFSLGHLNDEAAQTEQFKKYEAELVGERLRKLEILLLHYGCGSKDKNSAGFWMGFVVRLAIDVFPGFCSVDQTNAPRAAHRPRTRGKRWQRKLVAFIDLIKKMKLQQGLQITTEEACNIYAEVTEGLEGLKNKTERETRARTLAKQYSTIVAGAKRKGEGRVN